MITPFQIPAPCLAWSSSAADYLPLLLTILAGITLVVVYRKLHRHPDQPPGPP